jgi:broad specificity phosphatase PhoE
LVESRVPVEELDLSIRAFHVLKVLKMDFIEEIDLGALDHRWGREVRPEIAEKLRRWRDDLGEAPSPIRP